MNLNEFKISISPLTCWQICQNKVKQKSLLRLYAKEASSKNTTIVAS